MNKSIPHILDEGIALYQRSFSALFSTLFLLSMMAYSFYLIQHPTDGMESISFWFRSHPFIWFISQSVLLSLLSLMILHYQSGLAKEEEISVGIAFQKSVQQLPAGLLYFILISFLGFSAGLPFMGESYQNAWFVINSFCSTFILIYLLPMPALLVKNGTGILETMKRSVFLVQGNWLKITVVLSMVIFIYGALVLSVSMTGLLLLSFLPMNITRPDLLQMSLQLLLTTFFGGFLYSGYLALVIALDNNVESRNLSERS